MKAIRVHQFGGPDVMRLEELSDPHPGPGQILVRVRAAGVNPVDTYIRAGTYARRPALPYTPGTDASGVVERVGTGVTRLSPGDRVYLGGTANEFMLGAYAELAVCEEGQAHPLADHVSFAQGAGVNVPYATAYRALFHRAQAKPAETVLVHGASGGVGIAAVQLAVAHGMNVIGTGGTDQGRQLVRAQGAAEALDHRAPDYRQRLMALTGGRGFDVVLEMLANVNLNHDLTLLAERGRIVVIGSRGAIEVDPRLAMVREGTIHGMSLWNATAEELARIHAALVAGLRNRTLAPLVGQELSLGEAPRAHEAVMEPGAYGKIVLVI